MPPSADTLVLQRAGTLFATFSSSTHRCGCAFVLRPGDQRSCLAEALDRANEGEH